MTILNLNNTNTNIGVNIVLKETDIRLMKLEKNGILKLEVNPLFELVLKKEFIENNDYKGNKSFTITDNGFKVVHYAFNEIKFVNDF